jgi:hypothetical protein
MGSDSMKSSSNATAGLGRVLQEEAKAFLEMAGKKLWTKEQGIKDNLVDEDEADLTQPVQH